jgi:hypothetical protein
VCLTAAADADSDGERLSGRHVYWIHFKAGQLPPVEEPGYWSLTAYDEDGFLMRNPLDRYKVSGWDANLRRNEDASLDLYIQHTPPDEPRLNNYLPCGKDNDIDLCRGSICLCRGPEQTGGNRL